MQKVAFFVDGHFMRKRIFLFRSFAFRGPNIRAYCARHLQPNEKIYRIFFYDAPPLERITKYPSGAPLDLGAAPAVAQQKAFLDSIRETPDMALRLGWASWQHNDWVLKKSTLAKLLKTGSVVGLQDSDFFPNIRQKAVDMKIGLDIATITYKKLANRIVLIAGDSDFAPASKLARTEGMHVTLDPLGNKVQEDLLEHIDVMHTPLDPNNPADVDPAKKQFFVAPRKTL
jgi:uncharacterized LabA/DUF88 family protein